MALNFPLGLPTPSYSASCTLPLYSGRSFPFDFQVSLLTNTGIRNFGEFKSPANADFRNGEHLLKSQLDSTTRSLQHDLSDSHFNAADTLLSMKNSAMYRAGLNCQSTWTLSAPPLVSDFGPTTVDAQRVKDATQFHNYGVISRNNLSCASNMSQRYLVTSGRRESGADIPAQKKPIESNVEKIHHQCNVCKKTYGCSSALKTHLKLHSGEKAFKCQDCGKMFSQQANLKAHLRTHSGEKPFQCKVCKRRFAQSSSVTTHMRTHSGERPYQCTICGRGFADSSTLTKHIRVHTGERPYKCDVCHTKFSQSGNLKRHMSVHKKVMSIATLE